MATSVLLADVGNSRVKLCPFGHVDVAAFDWRDQQGCAALRRELQRRNPTRIVVASTSPAADQRLCEEVWSGFTVQQLTASDLPLQLLTTGVGIDRLLAAWLLFEQTQTAVLVADCGTAFTLDIVDAQGCFHGGVIGAGLRLQEQALAQACPHLVAPKAGTNVIPQSTASAVFAGTSRALAAALDGLASSFEQQLDCVAMRFLSGGDAVRLQALLPNWQRRDHLVLEALDLFVSLQPNGT